MGGDAPRPPLDNHLQRKRRCEEVLAQQPQGFILRVVYLNAHLNCVQRDLGGQLDELTKHSVHMVGGKSFSLEHGNPSNLSLEHGNPSTLQRCPCATSTETPPLSLASFHIKWGPVPKLSS
eukprot:3323683-Amphidinium_carterae.1